MLKNLTRHALCAALSFGAASLVHARCEAQTATPAPTLEDGALVQGTGPMVYVIINGQRRWVRNEQAFNGMGFSWAAVVRQPDAAVNAIPLGTPVATFADLYAEETLLKSAARPNVYMIHGGRRQHIANEATFNALHLDWSRVRTIPEAFLQRIPEGLPIAIESAPPARPSPASGGLFRPGVTPHSLGVNGAHGATMWAVTMAAGAPPTLNALAQQARDAHVVGSVSDLSCAPAVGGAYPRTVPPGESTQVFTVLFSSRGDAQGFASALVQAPLRVGRVRVMCAD